MAADGHQNNNNQNYMPKLEASDVTAYQDAQIISSTTNDELPHQQHQQLHPNSFYDAIAPNFNSNGNIANVINGDINNGLVPLNNGALVLHDHIPHHGHQEVNHEKAYFDSLPPGYRFCPLDEELIQHYLFRKANDLPLPRNKICAVNIYKYSPEEITEMHESMGENQWYFFTPRGKKYLNGSRPSRSTESGFWKATGADKTIYGTDEFGNKQKIGYKKALVYYDGKAPKGQKTNWIMQEFTLSSPDDQPQPPKKNNNTMVLDKCVLCKVYKKVDKSLKGRDEEPNEVNTDQETGVRDEEAVVVVDGDDGDDDDGGSDDGGGNDGGNDGGGDGGRGGRGGGRDHFPNFAPHHSHQDIIGATNIQFSNLDPPSQNDDFYTSCIPAPSSRQYFSFQPHGTHHYPSPMQPHHQIPPFRRHQQHRYPPPPNINTSYPQVYTPHQPCFINNNPVHRGFVDMKPPPDHHVMDYPSSECHHPINPATLDNSVSQYLVDHHADFDNTIMTSPPNYDQSLENAGKDSSSSQQQKKL